MMQRKSSIKMKSLITSGALVLHRSYLACNKKSRRKTQRQRLVVADPLLAMGPPGDERVTTTQSAPTRLVPNPDFGIVFTDDTAHPADSKNNFPRSSCFDPLCISTGSVKVEPSCPPVVMESTNTNNGDVELGSETLITESISAGLPLFHISDSQYNEMPCDISNQSLVGERNNDPLAFRKVENKYPAGSFGDKVPVQGSTVVATWSPSEVSSLQQSNEQNYVLTDTISKLKDEIDIKDHFVDMEYLDAGADQAQPVMVRTSSDKQTIPGRPPPVHKARATSVVLSNSSRPQISEMASTFPSAERSSVAPSTRKKGVKKHKCPVCNSLMVEDELPEHLKTHETSAVIETRRSRHSSAADVLKIFPCSKCPFTAISTSELSEHLEDHEVAEAGQSQAETSRPNTTLPPIASTSTNAPPDPGRVTLKVARIPVASTPLNGSVERRIEQTDHSAGQLFFSNLITDSSRRSGMTLSLPTESVARDCLLGSPAGLMCHPEMANKHATNSRVGSLADTVEKYNTQTESPHCAISLPVPRETEIERMGIATQSLNTQQEPQGHILRQADLPVGSSPPVFRAYFSRPELDANQSHPSESSNQVLPYDGIPMHPQLALRAPSSREIPNKKQYTSKESALPCVSAEALQLPIPSLRQPTREGLSTFVPLSERQETSLRGNQVKEGVTSSESISPFGQRKGTASSDSFDGDSSDSGSFGIVGTASSSAPKARKKRAISVEGSSDGETTAIDPDYIPPSREKLPLKTPQSVLNEIPYLDSLVRKRFVACDSDQETPRPENDCYVCRRKFDTDELLKNHREQRLSNLQCCKCNFKTATEELLKRHTNTHTGPKTYTCDECNAGFNKRKEFVGHFLAHKGDFYYKCDGCGMGFQDYVRYEAHVNKERNIAPYKCLKCDLAYVSKAHIIIHNTNKHSRQVRVQCTLCKQTVDKHWLADHMKRHEAAYQQSFKCEFCSKVFKTKRSLEGHETQHTGFKPFVCTWCGAAFGWKPQLRKHERVHTGERPYKCDECGKTFAGNPAFKVHLRIHTGERPYKCEICSMTFAQPSPFAVHKRKHTGERPYQCKVCPAAFASNSQIKNHMRTHENSASGKERKRKRTKAEMENEENDGPTDRGKKTRKRRTKQVQGERSSHSEGQSETTEGGVADPVEPSRRSGRQTKCMKSLVEFDEESDLEPDLESLG